MKKLIAALVAVLMVVSFAACGGKTTSKLDTADLETYEFDGLTIQMEKGMEIGSQEGFDAFASSTTCMMTGVKEGFDLFTSYGYDPENMTLEEYGELVAQANEQFNGDFSEDANGNLAVTYTYNVEGTNYYYHATVAKGTDSFWVITFACFEGDQSEYADQFEAWANTIVVK